MWALRNRCEPLHTLKPLLAALLMAFPPLLMAATGQVIPGAGTLLQQVLPAMPSLPARTAPAMEMNQNDDANPAPEAPFSVSAINISGNTVFDTPTLHALVAEAEGQNLTMSRLNELVARISTYYHNKGYPLARAIIPAQRMVSGVVRVVIVEGRYGKVELASGSLQMNQKDDANPVPEAPFSVSAINISGNTVFDTPALHALVTEAEGQNLTLSRLNELVARISTYYHSKGYPLARAIVPGQRMVSGVVRVVIIEARYGKVELANGSHVNAPLLLATLTPLQSRQIISQTELDHTLLLMSDIPGVTVSATLRPGVAVGSSDLLINAAQSGPTVLGNVTLDNDGNRFTGRVRAGGSVNVINPLHHGDILSANLLSSGSEMNYGRLAYDTLLNGKSTRLGGSWSALRYALGEPLDVLGGHGTAQVASLWGKQTLLRSQNANLYGQIQFDRLQLRDHIDTSAIRTDRHLNNWTMSIIGDERDAFMQGGVTTWNVGASAGRVGFDDGRAQLADAATAQTAGTYSKWNANLIRLQGLSPKNSLYLAFAAQRASGNLDSSQKISAGGPYAARAYDVALMSGDIGYIGTVELRRDLGSAWNGQWQAIVFVDGAHLTVNKSAWVAGANSATLRGFGVGLNWTGAQQWSTKIAIGAPLGTHPALAGDSPSARAWGEISRGF